MHSELMFPSDYVRAAELLGQDQTVRILSVALEDLILQGGAKVRKPVCKLAKTEKKLVLNKTNARTIAKLYGTETDDWANKRITLYAARVKFGREMVDAIRVRERVPPAKRNGGPPTSKSNQRGADGKGGES